MYARAVLTISWLLNPYQDLRNLTFTKCPSLRLLPSQRFLNATGKIQTNNYNHGHCGWSCTLISCFSSTILKRRNPIQYIFWLVEYGGTGAGGGGQPPVCDSFLFEVKRLKFSTEFIWDKINIL